MATDNSPPKIRIILTVAFSSVIILVALNYVFRSYFAMMEEETILDHLRTPEDLVKLRAGEQRNLTTSPIPIAKAMQEFALKGHEASPDLQVIASNDPGPLVGWMRTPNQAVLEALAAAAANPAPDAGAATTGGDAGAGALKAGDAGATASGAGDAGATLATRPTTKPAPKH